MSPTARRSRMARWAMLVACVTAALGALGSELEQDPPVFQLDGDAFVVFYDLPSRRFHAIRQAFVRRELATVSQDASVSAEYMRIEAQRAHPAIREALQSASSRLLELGSDSGAGAVRVEQFDQVFARAHWLLAQHFLYLATQARKDGRYARARHLPQRLLTPRRARRALVQRTHHTRAHPLARRAQRAYRQIAGEPDPPGGRAPQTGAECGAGIAQTGAPHQPPAHRSSPTALSPGS